MRSSISFAQNSAAPLRGSAPLLNLHLEGALRDVHALAGHSDHRAHERSHHKATGLRVDVADLNRDATAKVRAVAVGCRIRV